MTFVSVTKYSNSQGEELCDALLRFASLILQAIRLHAVECDGVDCEKFKADIRALEDALAKPLPPVEVLAMAGAAATALENYNQQASRFLRAQSKELQTMAALLARTQATVSESSERAVSRLAEIERQLERAPATEDPQAVKVRLAECLDLVRRECAAQREEAARTVAGLEEGMPKPRGARAATVPEASVVDSVTGLPRREEAEAALAELLVQGRPAFAGVFHVERADLITSRFGQAVADQVLIFLGQHLAQGLGAEDRLYRWAGSAFIALLDSRQDIEQVRRDLARLLSVRLQKHFDLGSRSVLLPVSCSWTALPCFPQKSTHVLIQQIDAFLNAQLRGSGAS